MHDSDATATPDSRQFSVLIPLPLAGPYDYCVEANQEVHVGDFVLVPLGPREVIGVVWGEGRGDVDPGSVRAISGCVPASPLPADLREFVEWVSRYTLAPPGSVLRMAMSVPSALEPPRPRRAYQKSRIPDGLRLTPARRRVLAVLADGPPRDAADLRREAGASQAVLSGLVEAGALEVVQLPPLLPFGMPDLENTGPELSGQQAEAARALSDEVREGQFAVSLLEGVTGSGKTEVYLDAVATALAAGRQVLVLLPEIALTPQWLDRFVARFGTQPAVWHSDVKATRRRLTWRAIASGDAPVVVGARSALFLPYADLGLIVVDEEHDPAFKQEDGVAYHARDMAVVRGQIGGFPVILVSATPSLETRINVERGRYRRVHLPERHGAAVLPPIEAIDLREHAPPRGGFLAPPLREALTEVLARGEQALLFLNRRGYAPLTLCRHCGHRFGCPNCTAWLVEHRFRRQLQCHHCGFAVPRPDTCPRCGTADMLVACGPGVERIAEEVETFAPGKRIAVMTSDSVHGPDDVATLVKLIADREVDLLIGTQMVAKGHHFPFLTLVGIVDADLGLSGGDLRAAERTYQMLQQVAGRAGRAEHPGRVLLQTYEREHPVLTALMQGEDERFFALEKEAREFGGWPPFGRLAALIVTGRDPDVVDRVAGALGRSAPEEDGVRVLGPAPAPFAVLRGQHRRRLLLKTARAIPVQPLLRNWLDQVKVPSSVRVRVDVDPYSFL